MSTPEQSVQTGRAHKGLQRQGRRVPSRASPYASTRLKKSIVFALTAADRIS